MQKAIAHIIVSSLLWSSIITISGKAFSQNSYNDTIQEAIITVKNGGASWSVLNKEESLNIEAPSQNEVVNLFKKADLHGNITAGYEYGVLPFVFGDNFPAQGYRSEGEITFSVKQLPLQLNFFYTNIKNVIGVNNYFRISYDANKYNEHLKNEIGGKKQLLNTQIVKLRGEQQSVGQKIQFYEYLQDHPDFSPPTTVNSKGLDSDSINRFQTGSNYSINDSLGNNDSLTYSVSTVPTTDTLHNEKWSESLNNINASDSLNKSNASDKKTLISQQLRKYTSKNDSISEQIQLIKDQIQEIENYEKYNGQINNPYLTKANQILSGIKKFEIGLCNPSSSTFLVNNLPLQGINIEYEKNARFLAFTYGTSINNLLFNSRTVDGVLQGTRNYYNFFDFGNLKAGRKILMIKGGVGTKEGSHLFVGALIGKGEVDYVSLDISNNTKESNLVLEIDGKYNFNSSITTEFALGKSSVTQEDISSSQLKSSINEIFSNYRSYALLSRTSAVIAKTRTNLAFTLRWVDPYFKSFGLGFLRSDNFRYEIKADQFITKKIKYTLAFRKEEDNLLKLYNYKNILYSLNNSVNLRLTRKLNIRLIYVPLFRKLRFENTVITDKNQIVTAVLSWSPKTRNMTTQFNGLYSNYMVSGDSNNVNFESFTYAHQLIFKSGFKTDLNLSWFKNNLRDSTGNNTYLGLLDIGYTFKKQFSVSLGGKFAFKNVSQPQYGFAIKSKIHIYKNLSAEIELSKIIIGDYYNTFDQEIIGSFPYYCKGQLSLNF